MSARHVTSAEFEQQVLQADRPTLVDFYAEWCGPCRAMGGVVDELAADSKLEANVVKVNVDESPDLATRFGVQSIPTFIVVKNGVASERLVGVQTKEVLESALAG